MSETNTHNHGGALDTLSEANALLDTLRSTVLDARSWTDQSIYGVTLIIGEIESRIERATKIITEAQS